MSSLPWLDRALIAWLVRRAEARRMRAVCVRLTEQIIMQEARNAELRTLVRAFEKRWSESL